MEHSTSLPYASTLCGACYEVCPVKINIPEILIHLRRRIVEEGSAPLGERLAMKAAAFTFGDSSRLSAAQKFARLAQRPFTDAGHISKLPGPLGAWTEARNLPAVPAESFRQWWAKRDRERSVGP
jgi:L-lactate dehydrogenase complex protein LldF